METIKLKKDRIAVEKIKKTNILATSEANYDYEKYKFKVVSVGENVNNDLVGKTIVKQEKLGIEIEISGKELIIIREEDILAEI